MTKALEKYREALDRSKEKFEEITKRAGRDTVKYDNEYIFAMQLLTKNDYVLKVAQENPASVQLAMLNVASTGLTLNPAHGYAYLVPRDGAIVLDISYKGLIKIATDAGSILWARADVVYENDEFEYNGPAAAPLHKAKVFSKDRGELIGAYSIAKTKDGDILTEVMDRAEIEKIRGKSQAYAKKKSGPWVEFFTEMCRKSVTKRSSKTWPYTDQQQRLLDAVELANAAEGGYDFEGESVELVSPKEQETIQNLLVAAQMDVNSILKTYDIQDLSALPRKVFSEVVVALQAAAERVNKAA